jgi:hypothetical protein
MKYFRDARRWEIGGTGMFTQGTYNGVIPVFGHNNMYIHDTTVKRSIYSEPGFGVTLGVTVPFAATGHISNFSLSLNAVGNYYKWNSLNKSYNLDGTYKTYSSVMNATTIQIGAPVGIDYKIGCDAIGTKRLRWGGALGAGVIPQLNITSLDSTNDLVGPQVNVGLNPFFKAEGGVFIGIFVKVRVMYTLGNVELMNVRDKIDPYTHGPFKLTNNNHWMFSLILQPFSYKWRETSWYNDYDTYNWNEKLN